MRNGFGWIARALVAITATALFCMVPETAGGVSLAMIFGTRKLEGSDLFAKTGRRSKRLDSKSLVKELILAHRYSFTHAGTDVGDGFVDAAWRTWRMITGQGDYRGDRVTFLNVVPRDIRTLLNMLEPNDRVQTSPDFDGADPEDTDDDLLSELPLPFYALGGDDKGALGLPLMAIRNFELITDGGAPTDLMTDEDEADGAAAFSNVETDVYEERFLDRRHVPDALRTLTEEYDVNSSGNGNRYYLPEIRKGMEVVRVMVVAEVDDEKSDDVITNIGLSLDGREPFEKLQRGFYQRRNYNRYGLDEIETGVVLFDFVDDGSFRDLYTIASSERPYIHADVEKQAGVNKLRVVAQYVDRAGASRNSRRR